MERFIDIVIAPDGTINIDMECYKGSGCDVDFKKLVKAMDATVSSSKKKQDYYEQGKVKIKGQSE